MSNRRRNNAPYRAVIYLRYILPIIFCFTVMVLTLIPCLTYTTPDGPSSAISARELFKNSWDQVRGYLFNTAEQTPAIHNFSVKLLIMLIAFSFLFTVGLVSTVAVAVCVFRYLSRKDRKDTVWLWFITIIPNRIVVCVLQGLTLPVLFLSRMIIPMYRMMGVGVTLATSFPEPWVWGLVFYAISIILSIVSSILEKDYGMNAFKRPEKPIVRVVRPAEEKEEEEYRSLYSVKSEFANDEAREEAKEKQAELIRKLLNNDDEENTK